MFDGKKITFGGKTDNAQIPAALVTRLNDIFLPQIDTFLAYFGTGEGTQVCLYGEGYGSKIQKGGGNYRSDQDFVLFDVLIAGWWLERPNMEDVAKKLELDVVPIIGIGTLTEMVNLVRDGFDSKWGDFRAEGIVARPYVELKRRDGSRIITKVKCRDFDVSKYLFHSER